MKKMEEKIDFVITWVDGNDSKWQAERAKYCNEIFETTDNNKNRYRDMDCLKYWFRGVEKYAPWVDKIHFVTCGQIPDWLNIDTPKLHLVNHSDYIPKKYLPTFNSNAIEMMLHKIEGLNEHFVYFNDDMFLINRTKPTDFFKNGKPCGTMLISPISPDVEGDYYRKILNNIAIIKKNFSYQEFKKNNKNKFCSLKLGKIGLKNLLLLKLCNTFVGFKNYHCSNSFVKTSFEKVWNAEKEALEKTMSYRFRNNTNSVNIWLFEYWQFAEGNYNQRSPLFGCYTAIKNNDIEDIIINPKYKVICLNDTDQNLDFENKKACIKAIFDKKFPNKSQFEK